MLGAADPHRRSELIDRLYTETASHFRKIRVVEIQKQEQRSKSKTRRLTADDLAADIWEAANLSDWRPLAAWLAAEPGPKKSFIIPDGAAPRLMPASDMYERNVMFFGKGRSAAKTVCEGRGQAELLARVASLGLRGAVAIPASEQNSRDGLERLEARLTRARTEFAGLAESRGGNEKTRGEVVDLLTHWFVHGRGRAAQSTRATRQLPSSTTLPPS